MSTSALIYTQAKE
jgi:hypothetical protein